MAFRRFLFTTCPRQHAAVLPNRTAKQHQAAAHLPICPKHCALKWDDWEEIEVEAFVCEACATILRRTNQSGGEGEMAGRTESRHVAILGCAMATAGALLGSVMSATAQTPSGTPPSPIGGDSVKSIAVSPAYLRTGLVIAFAQSMSSSCGSSCVHLWVSHDGGATWSLAAARGWSRGVPQIAVDGGGHEMLIAPGSTHLQRSVDAGANWTDVGPPGTTTILPSFAHDGGILVAANGGGGNADFLVTSQGQKSISGSGSAAKDVAFAVPPTYPGAGAFPPALLGAMDAKASTGEVLTCNASLACANPVVLPSNDPMAGPPTLVMSPSYAMDGTAFAYTGTALFKSMDGGRTFSRLVVGDVGTVVTSPLGMAVAPDYNDHGPQRTAYVAITEIVGTGSSSRTAGGVYKTIDGGTTWTSISTGSPLEDGASTVALAPDGRLFAGYLGTRGWGLLCNAGQGWHATCPAIGAGIGSAGNSSARPCGTCTPQAGGAAAAGAGTSGSAGEGQSGPSPSGASPGVAAQAAVSGGRVGGRSVWLVGVALALAALLAAAAVLRRRARPGAD